MANHIDARSVAQAHEQGLAKQALGLCLGIHEYAIGMDTQLSRQSVDNTIANGTGVELLYKALHLAGANVYEPVAYEVVCFVSFRPRTWSIGP